MKIILDNVTKIIKNNTVIDNVSFTFSSEAITGLKGINGSGKTMLLRLISGLIKPTTGKIFIDDKQLWKDISFPPSIGILIENPAFLDSYSAFGNLKLLAEVNSKIGDKDIKDILSEVALDPYSKKKFKYFSLGMKQRLGIAAAVMEHPDIILLDEPTNALDSDGIDILKNILLKEKKRGALIILTCHDYSILRELSDGIVFIKEGKITDYEAIQR
jgi:ABC-2 type transport system ATP-binding protein